MDKLREMAEVIIVDSPPIGLFPDSLAIARKAEEVLFVTRYGKVSRKVAKKSFWRTYRKLVQMFLVSFSMTCPKRKHQVITIQAITGMVTLDINTIINIMVKY